MSRRSWRWRTLAALFIVAVGAILGVVPGWTMCACAWLIAGLFALALLAIGSLGNGLVRAALADWPRVRNEAAQLAVVASAMIALPFTPTLSTWVELARARGDLVARAQASARAGGPLLAMTNDDERFADGGIVYDAGGEIAQPASRRSAAWSSSREGAFLGGECVGVRHLVGAFYRWSDACGFP